MNGTFQIERWLSPFKKGSRLRVNYRRFVILRAALWCSTFKPLISVLYMKGLTSAITHILAHKMSLLPCVQFCPKNTEISVMYRNNKVQTYLEVMLANCIYLSPGFGQFLFLKHTAAMSRRYPSCLQIGLEYRRDNAL